MAQTPSLSDRPARLTVLSKLDEAILVARRFRHEQPHRADIERLISEFAALGARETDPTIAQLNAKAIALLMKVSDKKIHVANIEAEGESNRPGWTLIR